MATQSTHLPAQRVCNTRDGLAARYAVNTFKLAVDAGVTVGCLQEQGIVQTLDQKVRLVVHQRDTSAGACVGQAGAVDGRHQHTQLAAGVGGDVGDVGVEAFGFDTLGRCVVKLITGKQPQPQLGPANGDVCHTSTLVVAVVQQYVVEDVDVLQTQAALTRPKLGLWCKTQATDFDESLLGAHIAAAPLGRHVLDFVIGSLGLEGFDQVDLDAVVALVAQPVALHVAAELEAALDAVRGAEHGAATGVAVEFKGTRIGLYAAGAECRCHCNCKDG